MSANSPLALALLWPIRAYQRWISPALAPRCRFYPSCSEYAVEAISTHGAVKGFGLAVVRLVKCAPWHPGGVDLVPPRRTPLQVSTGVWKLEKHA